MKNVCVCQSCFLTEWVHSQTAHAQVSFHHHHQSTQGLNLSPSSLLVHSFMALNWRQNLCNVFLFSLPPLLCEPRCSNKVLLNNLSHWTVFLLLHLPLSPLDRDRMYSISQDWDAVEGEGGGLLAGSANWQGELPGPAGLVSLHHLLHWPPALIPGPGRQTCH